MARGTWRLVHGLLLNDHSYGAVSTLLRRDCTEGMCGGIDQGARSLRRDLGILYDISYKISENLLDRIDLYEISYKIGGNLLERALFV